MRTFNRKCFYLASLALFLTWLFINFVLLKDSPSHRRPVWPQNVSEPYQIMATYDRPKPLRNQSVRFKKILFWNEAYGSKKYGVGHGRQALRQIGCPIWQCETTDLREAVNEFDAIVFHLRSWDVDDLPFVRTLNQRYVFWSIESPAHNYVNTDLMNNFFNWTMTYRWDSDFVRPYGWVEPISDIPLHPDESSLQKLLAQTRRPSAPNYAANKSRMAAWFVSNCQSPSGREDYVRSLQNLNISIDIYGQCGNYSCPRSNADVCRDLVQRHYKFYVAFENSLCLDYVTEKFFAILKYNVIPIVLPGSHAKLAPTHSFINAGDFASPESLAAYLINLDNNDALYNEYFWWKPYFRVRRSEQDVQKSMCQLCAALHNPNKPIKVYEQFTDWWELQANCTSMNVDGSKSTNDIL